MVEGNFSLEDARKLTATLARQMDLSASYGRWTLADSNTDKISFEAGLYAEALRIILRAAGLSDDWEADPGKTDEAVPNAAEQ